MGPAPAQKSSARAGVPGRLGPVFVWSRGVLLGRPRDACPQQRRDAADLLLGQRRKVLNRLLDDGLFDRGLVGLDGASGGATGLSSIVSMACRMSTYAPHLLELTPRNPRSEQP